MIVYDQSSCCVSFRGCDGIKATLAQRTFSIAFIASIPVALLGAVVKLLDLEYKFMNELMPHEKVYGIFAAFFFFLMVFRTGHAYTRFTEGVSLVHKMTIDFLDATSILLSLARAGDTSSDKKDQFGQVVVRVVSMLSALCMADLSEVSISNLDSLSPLVLDVQGLDRETLDSLDKVDCKTEVVCSHLQNLIVDSLGTVLKGVPPPLLTRVFQELNSGMRQYHDALKFANYPFPFPFVAVVEVMIAFFCIFTPLQMAQYTQGALGCAGFSFAFAFFVWVLYGLQAELDNPFGDDINDIEMASVQDGFNCALTNIMRTGRCKSPSLSGNARDLHRVEARFSFDRDATASSSHHSVSVRNRHFAEELTARESRHPSKESPSQMGMTVSDNAAVPSLPFFDPLVRAIGISPDPSPIKQVDEDAQVKHEHVAGVSHRGTADHQQGVGLLEDKGRIAIEAQHVLAPRANSCRTPEQTLAKVAMFIEGGHSDEDCESSKQRAVLTKPTPSTTAQIV